MPPTRADDRQPGGHSSRAASPSGLTRRHGDEVERRDDPRASDGIEERAESLRRRDALGFRPQGALAPKVVAEYGKRHRHAAGDQDGRGLDELPDALHFGNLTGQGHDRAPHRETQRLANREALTFGRQIANLDAVVDDLAAIGEQPRSLPQHFGAEVGRYEERSRNPGFRNH
jgi:hypothetical protein